MKNQSISQSFSTFSVKSTFRITHVVISKLLIEFYISITKIETKYSLCNIY